MAGTAMQAIEFVQMQRDDELWELLISLALESPALTGILPFTAVLTHTNMYICGQLLFAGPNRPASCLEAGLHLLLVILKLYCLDSSCMGHMHSEQLLSWSFLDTVCRSCTSAPPSPCCAA